MLLYTSWSLLHLPLSHYSQKEVMNVNREIVPESGCKISHKTKSKSKNAEYILFSQNNATRKY